MTVVILGGHDRLEAPLKDFAKDKGINLKFINKPSQNLEDMVACADFILVLTRLVSHEMVKIAKKWGTKKCLFCKQGGICQIKKLLEEIINSKFFVQ